MYGYIFIVYPRRRRRGAGEVAPAHGGGGAAPRRVWGQGGDGRWGGGCRRACRGVFGACGGFF